MAKMERNRLKKIQRYLNHGQLTMIGDGIYEKNNCACCNEQHRVASVKAETRKSVGKKCLCSSILSKTPSTTSSADSFQLPPINSPVVNNGAPLEQQKGPMKDLETFQCDRDFYREMLSQEENALIERLKFERKLLEETDKLVL